MTSAAGTGGFGTVFKVTAAEVHTVLVYFTGNNGANPVTAPMVTGAGERRELLLG